MHNYQRYRAKLGDAAAAVRETLRTTGKALMVTSIVLVAAFMVNAAGTMINVRNFGLITSFCIALAFLADVLLAPALGVLLDRGLKVALVTDGRMSGASGKVPAAIHVTPEAADGGPLSRVRDGDLILVDARTGRLEIKVDAAELAGREPARAHARQTGFGRELFGWMRRAAGPAEAGASVLFEEVA